MTPAAAPAVSAETAPSEIRHVERVMGTVVSVVVREADDTDAGRLAVERAIRWLHEVDRRFSTYRPDSEISRIARSDLSVRDAHPDVRAVLAMCEALRVDSGGVFDASIAGRDGGLDPSGLVKGWAVERAAQMLAVGGCRAFAIDAGGDVAVAGGRRLPESWRVGIRHPGDAERVAAVVRLDDGAVATSGTYERGDHLRRLAMAAEGGDAIRSMTVVGPDLIWADAYATTAFLMGRPGLAWVADHDGYEAIAVIGDRLVRTAGTDRYLTDPA